MRALRGPNRWSRGTAIEAIVVCSENELCLGKIPGFDARLQKQLPDLPIARSVEHGEARTLAHAVGHLALHLQVAAGCQVGFCRIAATSDPVVFQVVVEYSEEEVGRLAFELASELCRAVMTDLPFDLADALSRLRALDEDVRFGPSTGAIIAAATRRGIPYRRMTEGSLVQLGWGSRQRRIQAAETDGTDAVAEAVAQDKEITKKLLHDAGVPVPQGRLVKNLSDAWKAACELDGPVVVKPRDGNQGKGITVNIRSHEEVTKAYQAARQISGEVIVERYLPGHDFRLLVVGENVVAASHRAPPQVTGDGAQSIEQLVEQLNRDPRRGDGHATFLTKITLDDVALATLAMQGYAADSVPPRGKHVILRNNANLSTGGTATDVTDLLHPELAARAVEAAQVAGLDVCGVDLVCTSVEQPLEEQGGGVVEVNAAPGLRMHLQPSSGMPRPVGEAIISSMFADGEDGRIPLVAVTGTNGKTTTVRLIARILEMNRMRVGMTSTDGVYVAGRRIDTGDCSGPKSARNVLLHPDVDAAVLETARGGLLREGLGFDRCDVAVVTNVGSGDHLGLDFIDSVEQLAAVKGVIVRHVAADGMAVLNAADPLVAGMAADCAGAVTFAPSAHHPVLAAHRAKGGRMRLPGS